MSSEDKILQEGYITSARGNGFFMVEITHENGNAQQILCKLSGKMRKNNIRVLEEDFVKVEISPYDLTKGVIIFRRR